MQGFSPVAYISDKMHTEILSQPVTQSTCKFSGAIMHRINLSDCNIRAYINMLSSKCCVHILLKSNSCQQSNVLGTKWPSQYL